MEFKLKRGIVRQFRGFPPDDQNEGHAEHAAMAPVERLELTAFIRRQYIFGILNLPEFPRLDRTAVRMLRRGDGDE